MKNFHDLVLKARSCRRFREGEAVSADILETLLDVVRCAPSSINLQPLRYAYSVSPEINERIFPHLRWAVLLKDWPGPAEGERPAAYIIIGGTGPDGKHRQADLGVAGQIIQLGLACAGLGCCMLANIDAGDIHSIVGFPEDISVLLVLAVGVPAESICLDELQEGQGTAYWRDDAGRHHVPKRSLESVLLARFR